MSKPVVIDICCGLGGWTRGFLAEGYDAIGFDIERHRYPARALDASGPVKTGGNWNKSNEPMGFNVENVKRLNAAPLTGEWQEYPGHLILKDIREINGYDLRAVNPTVIVASPPCQRYSYMAQPWKRAKREGRWQRWERDSPFGDRLHGLNELFQACFRIARQAGCPIVLENVKGAQPWVGRAQANYGSYYLWGDVANVGGRIVRRDGVKFGMPSVRAVGRGQGGAKCPGNDTFKITGHPCGKFTDPRYPSSGVRGASAAARLATVNTNGGTKQGGDWFNDKQPSISRQFSSRSPARKAASAMIAEIPFELAQHVARIFTPPPSS